MVVGDNTLTGPVLAFAFFAPEFELHILRQVCWPKSVCLILLQQYFFVLKYSMGVDSAVQYREQPYKIHPNSQGIIWWWAVLLLSCLAINNPLSLLQLSSALSSRHTKTVS